jgi:hypothetical protein
MTGYQAGAFTSPNDGSYEEIKGHIIPSSYKVGVMLINPELMNAINEQVGREFGASMQYLAGRGSSRPVPAA